MDGSVEANLFDPACSFYDSEVSYGHPERLFTKFHDIATTDRTTDTEKARRTGKSSSKAIDKRSRERIKKTKQRPRQREKRL